MPILGVIASAITGNLGLRVDYLVVAGGGGGGTRSGGGGGAGGYIAGAGLSLAFNTSYTVTVERSPPAPPPPLGVPPTALPAPPPPATTR